MSLTNLLTLALLISPFYLLVMILLAAAGYTKSNVMQMGTLFSTMLIWSLKALLNILEKTSSRHLLLLLKLSQLDSYLFWQQYSIVKSMSLVLTRHSSTA